MHTNAYYSDVFQFTIEKETAEQLARRLEYPLAGDFIFNGYVCYSTDLRFLSVNRFTSLKFHEQSQLNGEIPVGYR